MTPLPSFGQAAANPRRRLFGPRLGLPLMALGIAAMVPARVVSLLPLFEASAPVTTQPARVLPDPAPIPNQGSSQGFSQGPSLGRVAAGQPVPLREGILAMPTLSVLLAGPGRANPVGEENETAARLLAEVARRQAEAERRERMIEVRETRATAAETLARVQLATLSKLRDEMERLVVREATAADADIDSLVALYVNMRPQQAAKVLERLEAPRAATILLKIPERQAGPIMAQMDPQAALLVTQEIAGRREAFRRNPT